MPMILVEIEPYDTGYRVLFHREDGSTQESVIFDDMISAMRYANRMRMYLSLNKTLEGLK